MKKLWNSLGLAGQIAAGVVAAIVVIVAVSAVLRVATAPQRAREAEIQSRTDRAHTDAAKDAIDTITTGARRDTQTQEKIDEVVKQIESLPPAERDDATVRALCVLKSTRSDPRCADLQRVDPGVVGSRHR